MFHGLFPAHIILLEYLDSVARAELDLRNQYTMEPRSKITEDRPRAPRAPGILLF